MITFSVHLVVEMLLDAVMVVMGILLIVRAQDNRLRRVWGVMVLLLGLSMLYDNSNWLKYESLIEERGLNLLSFSMIMKWYFFVHVLTLFTIGSLRPGWLTPMRIIALSQPLIIVAVVVGCYYWFDGYITPLGRSANILPNLDRPDVQLRLAAFVLSILTPACNIVVPLLGRRIPVRKLSKGMYVYIGTFLLLVCAYVMFSLNLTPWILRTFGYVVVIFPTALSVMYFRDEDPLTLPCPAPENSGEVSQPCDYAQPDPEYTVICKLCERIADHMKTNTPFTDPDYSLDQLIKELGASRTMTMQAVKYGGFIGFREYVNFLRLEHFKRLAAAMPGATVKELMFRCGFTSRSSFYRHFAEQESISPKEYLEKLYTRKPDSVRTVENKA